jgi:hypothetical protein
MTKEEIKIAKHNFASIYDIKGGLIKTLAECTLDGRYYGSAVRITTRNLYQNLNKKTNFVDDIEKRELFLGYLAQTTKKQASWRHILETCFQMVKFCA